VTKAENCRGDRSSGAMLVAAFERSTDRARRVLVLAQEEARLLSHNFIGTEHLLLGLIHEGEGVAAQVLASLGINLVACATGWPRAAGQQPSPTTGSPPFTPRAKKVLELSLRQALQLGHNYIGTEHVLLGLVREGEGVAAQVLVSVGADLPRVRREVISAVEVGPSEGSGGGVNVGGRRDGPRCPACRSLLAGQVAYRILTGQPSDQDEASQAIEVAFVYCLRCGVVVAHAKAGDLGTPALPGGDRVRPHRELLRAGTANPPDRRRSNGGQRPVEPQGRW
jgi:hypothetical protein